MNPISRMVLGSAAIFGLSAAVPVVAQQGPPVFVAKPLPAPSASADIPLYAGVAPGSEGVATVERWEDISGQRVVRNVTRPVLIPVFPKSRRANGHAIIVAPGGGYQFLSIDSEGLLLAQRLAAQGYTAFVLKYRTVITPAESDAFAQQIATTFGNLARGIDLPPPQPLATADALAAVGHVRSHSAQWKLDPAKIGYIGFSAGARTGLLLAQNATDATMPNHIALIYGSVDAAELPAQVPPLFAAFAADDPIYGGRGFALVERWQARNRRVELHYYERGGHGFGMRPQGTTSDNWIVDYLNWLDKR